MKTRKNRINSYLKLGVFLFGISLLLWNCEKETDFLEVENQNKFTIIEKSLAEFQKEPKFSKTLQKVLDKKNMSRSEVYNFTIDTTKVREISVDNLTTYTLEITREQKNIDFFENLVISRDSLGEIKASLIKYTPSIEMRYIEPHHSFTFEGKTEVTPIDYNEINETNYTSRSTVICVTVDVLYCNETGEVGNVNYTTDHPAGEDCGNQDHFYIKPVTTCTVFIDGNPTETYIEDGPSSGGGGGTTSVSPDYITAPLYTFNWTTLFSKLQLSNFTDTVKINWLYSHWLLAIQIDQFLGNTPTQEEIDSTNSAINILSSPEIVSNNIPDYKTEILRMITILRQWGNPEDDLFADYVESILPDLNSMTIQQVKDFYQIVRNQIFNLTRKYINSIVTPFAESAIIVLKFAVFSDLGNVGLLIIRKIPQIAILRSGALKKLVKEVGELGVTGYTSNTRITKIITTSLPYSKAREIFSTLTRDAISITTRANGTIVADMGANRFITFRSLSQSSSGYVASIDLNFPNIWTYRTILKFQ